MFETIILRFGAPMKSTHVAKGFATNMISILFINKWTIGDNHQAPVTCEMARVAHVAGHRCERATTITRKDYVIDHGETKQIAIIVVQPGYLSVVQHWYHMFSTAPVAEVDMES
jgi:hypothetical protein